MIKEIIMDEYSKKYQYIVDDKLIGFIEVKKLYEVLDIIDVFIEEEYRLKGYASKLLEHIINNTKNIKEIMLEVKEDNEAAINLYKKFGFKVISERKNYYKDKTALIMQKKMDIYILAIESSCDETSVSIVKNGKEDISTSTNTQIDIHKKYGGVVPEIASRMHLENITLVLDDCLSKTSIKLEDIDAFSCTYGPGLLGSLLVGIESAKTLSFIYEKPFIKVNHMMGHISAANINNDLEYPLVALIISGGHTDLIYMESQNTFKYLGSTLDDAIGECFDKVARIMKLPYPGGPNIELLAKAGNDNYSMPEILNDNTYNFSYSGIKSYINNLVHNACQRGETVNYKDLAYSFQKAVTKLLVNKTKSAIINFKVANLIVVGGVASNTYIREELTKMAEELNVRTVIPEKKYCTDNATMIGAAAYVLFEENEFSELNTNAKSVENL